MKGIKYGGHTFKSNFEVESFKHLKKLKGRKKVRIHYETEKLRFTIVRSYLPDFILEFPSGHKRYIEIKGYLRSDDRTKLVSIKQQHPGIDLRIVFLQDNKLYKTSKSKYSDWADKNGIPYAIKQIPPEWLKE